MRCHTGEHVSCWVGDSLEWLNSSFFFSFYLRKLKTIKFKLDQPATYTLESRTKKDTAKILEGNSGTTAVNDKISSKFREQLWNNPNESTLPSFNYFYQCNITEPSHKDWKWAYFNPQEIHWTLLKYWFRHTDSYASPYLVCHASFSVISTP